MAIILNLDKLMKERNVTLKDLSKEVGISEVNLSNIKTGKVSAIRFSTLEKICEVLECQPGDVLEYKARKKVIPLFLDYSGTTDLLLSGGAKNVQRFFESIKNLENKSNCEVQITMVTGSALESARSKYKMLYELAENYGLPNLFDGFVAEYCGFLMNKDSIKFDKKPLELCTLDSRISSRRQEIEEIANEYGGKISPDVSSMYNIVFDEEKITRTGLAEASQRIEELIGDPEIETVTYYDDYGKECDVKPKKHTKPEAVFMLIKKLKSQYDIPFVIIGGDSQEEDLKMYTQNKQRVTDLGMNIVFIAPANIGEIVSEDKNIIVGNWENSDGISECINKLNSRLKVKEDGGLEI